MKTLRDIGENELLRQLLPRLPQQSGTVTGPGDDCAVLRLPGTSQDLLLTTDPVIEHQHFTPDTPPRLIGRKAIARAISDIAAMGGVPKWLLVNLVAPADSPLSRVRQIQNGLIQAAKTWRLGILGGDTAEGNSLELHTTAIGLIPRGTAILRSGARPRDIIYVTGSLGASWRQDNRHHLTFQPRLEAGQFLAKHRYATSMIDLSDGLATDLTRLLDASTCGAQIHADAIPISPAARKTDAPLEHALSDGEDFELLFTVSLRKVRRFEAAWHQGFSRLPATRIGEILSDPRQRQLLHPDAPPAPLHPTGFQHFSPPAP